MFETSASTEKLDVALAKAQGEFTTAGKNKINPHFKAKYSDLESVWAACRESLAKHQISVNQFLIHSDDNRVHVITRIAHAGEWMRCEFSVPVGKQDVHGYGSASTYIKRYALSAALGVASGDEDDDGNGSLGEPKPKPMVNVNLPPAAKVAPPMNGNKSTRNMAAIVGIATDAGYGNSEVTQLIADRFQKTKSSELTDDEMDELVKYLKANPKKRGPNV